MTSERTVDTNNIRENHNIIIIPKFIRITIYTTEFEEHFFVFN